MSIHKIPNSKYLPPILSTRERSALFFLMVTGVALIALGTFETHSLEFTAALYAGGGVLLSGTIAWYLATVKRRKALEYLKMKDPKVGYPEITFPLGEKILTLANQLELQTLYDELSKNLQDTWKKEVTSWKEKNPSSKTFPKAGFDAFCKKMLDALGKSRTMYTRELSKLKDLVYCADEIAQKVSKEMILKQIEGISFAESNASIIEKLNTLKNMILKPEARQHIENMVIALNADTFLQKDAASSKVASLLLKIRNVVNQAAALLSEVRSLLEQYPRNSIMDFSVMEKVIELACQYAHSDLLQILIDRHLITEGGYQKGIRCAAEHNATDCCQLLLRTKGDIQIERNLGFIHAIENGNLNLVRTFVQCGAGLSSNFGRFQQSPLHYAVEGLHEDIVQFLLSKGANPKSSSGLVKTPLQVLNSERVQTLVQNNSKKQHAFQKIQKLLIKR